ncbi:MAG: Na+:solute symporter [Gemmatimonadales bacterium]|nr:MAG: Na+:solute symporter [Gemmatimonadales bacterium]
MSPLDWWVLGAYMVGTLALGLALARRASGGMEAFFVGGRQIPWWLAGTSMAATTFSVDTPLYVAGVVGTRGIAGNWEWWSFAVAHVVLLYVFARLWSRARVVTDNELSELRYGGTPAAILRGTKGFLYAVVLGAMGIGLAMLAMVKVVEALELLPALGPDLGAQARLWTVAGVSLLVLVYAGIAGIWGVVVTDFLQFVLGMVGAVLVAFFAVRDVGGLGELVARAGSWEGVDLLAFTPMEWNGGILPTGWSALAGISGSTFLAYVFLQWWSFRRSDGGGEFVQRLAAARTEEDAERAAWLFNLLHYVFRTWPWVLVALAAVVLYPDLQDRELGYPRLMLDYLPAGLLGLVVASLVAAFMSTVSTIINWSASYLTNDVYARFLRRDARDAELVLAGRIASVAITALGGAAAFYAEDVTTLFRVIIAVGTGPGLVLILRWFWWRINAWTEVSAMVAGFAVGLGTSVVPILRIDDFGLRLLVTSLASVAVWLPVMLVTRPETPEVLESFYRRVRPGGPGWRRQRERVGLEPLGDPARDALRVGAGLALLFGLMFAVGGALLLRPGVAAANAALALAGILGLRRLASRSRPS